MHLVVQRVHPFAWGLGFLAATLGIAGCVTAGAKIPVTTPATEWSGEGLSGRRFVTEHFDIVSTVHDAEFENALPGFLEAAYKRFSATLPARVNLDAKLRTYIFGTRPEWLRFVRRHFPARLDVYARIRSGGFAEGDTAVLFFVNRSFTLATLAHEGWHQYVAAHIGRPIPAWLNEGLACCHEAVEFAGSAPTFTPRRNTFRINSLREAIQSDTLLPLSEIVDTDAGQVISEHHSGVTQLYYAQAWALVTFLRYGAGGRYTSVFDEMLADIAEGRFSARLSAARLTDSDGAGLSVGDLAFRTYFDHSPAEMEDQYYDHLIRITGF